MTRAGMIAIVAVFASAVARSLCANDLAAAQASPLQMWPTLPVTMVGINMLSMD